MKISFGVSVPTPDPQQGPDAFAHCFHWCERAEALGFDFVTLGHHRFTAGYQASPWVALGAIAARTTTLRLGTGVFILPLDHPLDVAEEVATVDLISGGRVFLGAGLGYRRYEWDALNLPYERRASRMEECLTVLQEVWTHEKASFHGSHFSFDDVTVLPRPVQQPRPPVWIGANLAPAIARAARLADAWIVGFGDRLDALGDRVTDFRLQSHANDRLGEICLMRLVGIGGSRESVESDWLPATLDMLRGYRRAGAPGERDDDTAKQSRSREGLRLGEAGQGMFIAGTPDDVIAGITEAHKVTGCEYLQPSFGGGGPDAVLRALELFGREVIPAFRSGGRSGTGACDCATRAGQG